MENFLPLRREVQDHWIYSDSQYLHLWLDFLFNARYSNEPKTDVYKGVMYTINRGEFLFSRSSYAKRLNITENRVRKCMDLLIKDSMIEQVGSLGKNKPTIYKIIKYDLYNNPPSETVGAQGVQEFSTKSPPSEHQVSTKSPPLKKIDKTDKKERGNTSSHKYEICDKENAQLLFSLMQQNNPDVKQPNLEKWSDDMRKIRALDNRTNEQIEWLIKWTQQDSFWSGNILSPSKLRKQWDQLVLKAKNEHEQKKNLRIGKVKTGGEGFNLSDD
jgi:hypothetical protein